MIISAATSYDEKVTASSTIIDKQGIVRYVIHQPMINSYLFQENLISNIKKSKSNQLEVPIVYKQQANCLNFKRDFAIVFSWSIPLKSRLFQIPTKSCFMIENFYPFQRNLMKISIGTQNGINQIPSEIALSNSDLSLSYNTSIVTKKTKFNFDERDNHQKKCRSFDQETIMKDIILKNVNLCVENLSKILTESCSDTEDQLTTSITQNIIQYEENNSNVKEDGIILHRGEQFGFALGEPMIRKCNSFYSIYELNRLLSKTNCLLMQQYQIETIEDLIRLYFEQGQEYFTKLMINLFKVNPFIVEQFNTILQRCTVSNENRK